jgi:Bacterial inner membrane protein
MSRFEALWTIPQLVGWGAFLFGMASFLQTSDRRFKQWMALECAAYVVHFVLLAQWTASASAAVSLGRSLAAVHYPFKAVGVMFMVLSLLCGAWLYTSWISWLPITASVLGTFALYFLSGIAMRLVMLCGTVFWLLHNYLVGSAGGTVLEGILCLVNVLTIWRLWYQTDLPGGGKA